MVNIYVFNPSNKLRLLSKLLLQASKRILKSVHSDTAMGLTAPTRPVKANISCTNSAEYDLDFKKPPRPLEKPVRDPEYYKDESQGGFCIFQVENRLFRVHRFFLMREPSALEDMLRFPEKSFNNHGSSDDNPIVLSDTAEQFRDLLWALYARPSDLQKLSDHGDIGKLLNISEMAHKYFIGSFRTWSVQCIYTLAKDGYGPLRNASSEVFARILSIATASGHEKLLDVLTKKLMSRILWHNMSPDPILPIAEKNELRRVQGICYYRQLTKMERDTPRHSYSSGSQLAIPLHISVDKRKRFFRAHNQLVKLWEQLRSNPPMFGRDGCPSHGLCLDTWMHLWNEAGSSAEILRYGPADVLGRLKTFMIYLRHSMNETPAINEPCMLSALETIAMIRDKIIENLMEYFEPGMCADLLPSLHVV
jgi:hypothetical protein